MPVCAFLSCPSWSSSKLSNSSELRHSSQAATAYFCELGRSSMMDYSGAFLRLSRTALMSPSFSYGWSSMSACRMARASRRQSRAERMSPCRALTVLAKNVYVSFSTYLSRGSLVPPRVTTSLSARTISLSVKGRKPNCLI